jgi:hypothetical protein
MFGDETTQVVGIDCQLRFKIFMVHGSHGN